MKTIMFEILFVLCLVCGGAWAMHHHDAKELDAIKADNASLVHAAEVAAAQAKIDDAVRASVATNKAVLARSHASAGHSLQAAAASAPAWADQPVPKEVQDALAP